MGFQFLKSPAGLTGIWHWGRMKEKLNWWRPLAKICTASGSSFLLHPQIVVFSSRRYWSSFNVRDSPDFNIFHWALARPLKHTRTPEWGRKRVSLLYSLSTSNFNWIRIFQHNASDDRFPGIVDIFLQSYVKRSNIVHTETRNCCGHCIHSSWYSSKQCFSRISALNMQMRTEHIGSENRIRSELKEVERGVE